MGPATESYTLDELFRRWESYGSGYPFSPEVLSEFDPAVTTSLYRCPGCEFGIFIPTVLGTDRFYRELSEMGKTWYYLPDKWEYRQALSILEGCRRILDVGCGKGFFLERCREAGVDAEGIELNSDAARIAREKGFPVHEEMLDVFGQGHREQFDAACLFQVLEHVADPRGVVADALACLKPGGYLVLAVPNMAGLVGRLEQVPANVPPHHVSRWTPGTLIRLADSFGLEVAVVRIEPFYSYLPMYLRERHLSRLPSWIMDNRLFGLLLNLPSWILRRVKPGGFDSIGGHTVIACLRKPKTARPSPDSRS